MVQPIFYSTDERVCKEHLKSFTRGMLDELPAWGKDCSDLTLKAVLTEYTITGSNLRYSEGYSLVIFVIICLCLCLIVLVGFMQWLDWWRARNERISAKQADLRRESSSDNEGVAARS